MQKYFSSTQVCDWFDGIIAPKTGYRCNATAGVYLMVNNMSWIAYVDTEMPLVVVAYSYFQLTFQLSEIRITVEHASYLTPGTVCFPRDGL